LRCWVWRHNYNSSCLGSRQRSILVQGHLGKSESLSQKQASYGGKCL
jgi:hypothetical protein